MGAVAHGGHCVARHEGRVVFVRHALPGEVVLARLTEAGERDRFWRADAVEILTASPDRVPARCGLSGPGGCGGCDWQHASLPAQRALKADVVREQLVRLGGLAPEDPVLAGLEVEPVPGDAGGLGWRTRVRFAVDASGRAGLRRHRSHDIVPVPECPIAHPEVTAAGVGAVRWPGVSAVEVTAADGDRLVVVQAAGAGRPPLPAVTAGSVALRDDDGGLTRVRGRTWLSQPVTVAGAERRFRVTGGGFWQGHPGAAQALLEAVLAAAAPAPGERALDLYAGVGLFAAGLAAAVGPGGSVLGVESDRRAGADARRSLHDVPWARFETGRVDRVLAALADPVDVVVLDPPRTGAGRAVVRHIAGLRPRVVVYVACDPAALGRDVAIARDAGYRLTGLRGFDAFPMTHHVECVATLEPAASA